MTIHTNERKGIYHTCRPGRPISKETWNRFLESGSWEAAPHIFGRSYADRSSFLPVISEKSAVYGDQQVHKRQRKNRYYNISIVSCGKVFADEVDKNRMLRILTGETVRWQLPVVDFTLLDDGLYLIVFREDGQACEYMLSQFTASLEGKYAAYYIKSKGLACTFMTDHVMHSCRDHQEALEECCRIHSLPVSRGIVEDIRRYWFSGYMSIQGKFAWDCMDPTPLLADVAEQPGKAVRYCENAHKSYLARNGIRRIYLREDNEASQKEN